MVMVYGDPLRVLVIYWENNKMIRWLLDLDCFIHTCAFPCVALNDWNSKLLFLPKKTSWYAQKYILLQTVQSSLNKSPVYHIIFEINFFKVMELRISIWVYEFLRAKMRIFAILIWREALLSQGSMPISQRNNISIWKCKYIRKWAPC